jgi:hypothetical protein
MDRVLRANYCLGYFLAEEESEKQVCASAEQQALSQDKVIAQLGRQVLAICGRPDRGEKLRRVGAYTLARHDPTNPRPALIARAQGEADFRRCGEEGAHSPKAMAYTERCQRQYPSDAEAAFQCAAQALSPICQKARQCETMDYMPY